ncbi:MAG: hypothetical protein ACPL5I_06290 [Thermodesulfobacteriota bacterium]
MQEIIAQRVKILILVAAVLISFLAGVLVLWLNLPKAFGGQLAPQMAQQGGRYQIAGCDSNSAWIIDTVLGDVFIIYANGKWKEVGSIMDEKKRIKK